MITAIGSYQYKHYQRLSEECQLMSCEWAGVNIDYFTLVVRAAGLEAVQYSREINEDPEYVDMLANGTVDVGWGLRRVDQALFSKVFFALPITGMTYGYVAEEDRTEVRHNFMIIFFDISTIMFVICIIVVNTINFIYEGFDVVKEAFATTEVRSIRGFLLQMHATYRANTTPRGMPISSRILLSFYFLATIIFVTLFQSLITSILVSDQVRGYDVTDFSKLLDKLEFDNYKALIWPSFRLQVYCKDDACTRWNGLKSSRTISALEKNEAYFGRISQDSKIIGFTSIGDELLRSDVIVFDRTTRQLFIADQTIPQQHFSFMISKKRPDLVEAFNRAIAMTSSVYPRIMARYIAPYGIYSKQIPNMEVSPMKLSNFQSVWQFFVVCVAIIIAVFIVELAVNYFEKRIKKG